MTARLNTLVALLIALTLSVAGVGGLAQAVTSGQAAAAPGGNGGGNGNGSVNGNGGENGHGQNGGGSGTLSANGSITLDQAGQALSLGDSVTFTTSVSGLSGNEWPMVYLECVSTTDGSLLYGQLDQPDTTFVLGGGSSQWWLVGGAAHCVAHLDVYGGKTPGTELASYAFDAAG